MNFLHPGKLYSAMTKWAVNMSIWGRSGEHGSTEAERGESQEFGN